MWIVSVMPLGPVAPHKEFAYWSTRPAPEGSIVAIRARGVDGHGLVMRSEALTDAKEAVRSADFSLQKTRGGGRRILTREFLRAAFEMARVHGCSAGAVVDAFVPGAVLKQYALLPEAPYEVAQARAKRAPERPAPQTKSYLGAREARAETILLIAQETLSSGDSCLIIAPTIAESERLAARLSEAALPTILLHGDLSVAPARKVWSAIAETKTPLVIVGTPMALTAPRRDIGAILLERAGARGYERGERPHLNTEVCAGILASTLGARFISLSSAPVLASLAHNEKIQIIPAPHLPPVIVDMRPPREDVGETAPLKAPTKKPSFELFAPSTLHYIREALTAGGSVALLCARHGLATQTICDDCGTAVTCEHCRRAMILRDEGKRIFRCSFCGFESGAQTLCKNCSGWRLKPLGIGLQRIAEEIKKLFPETPAVVLDEKTLASYRLARRQVAQFRSQTGGTLLVGTEGALPHLTAIPHAVVVSMDSFLSAPEYTANERALRFLRELCGLSQTPVIVQTRLPEHLVLETCRSGDLASFTKEELALREVFSYPPHHTLVQISLEGAQEKIQAQHDAMMRALAQHNPQTRDGRVAQNPRSKSKRIRKHMLLRLPTSAWPDDRLLAFLRALPPSAEIQINPPTLF